MQKITSCLWFDTKAEEAAAFYVSIFKQSKIMRVTRYDQASAEVSGRPEGSVLTVEFEIEGQPFTALNGGPLFKFTEAVSFVVNCETQAEVGRCWGERAEGGDERAQQCGSVKDKYGVSWHIVPTILAKRLTDADKAKAGRVMATMLRMKKLEIEPLRNA